jgi:hypothetical protein
MPHFLFSPVFFAPLLISLKLNFPHFPCPLSSSPISFRPVSPFALSKKSQEDGAVQIKANRDKIEKSRQRDRRRKWSEAGVTRK